MTTDQPTQPLDVVAIRAHAEAATKGPWMAASNTGRKDGVALVGATADRGTGRAIAVLAGTEVQQRHRDAEFIAAARTDVPNLLAEVERLRADVALADAEVKELREDLTDLAQARAVIDATRQMAIDANARLRVQLLAALDREDDGRTPLSTYVSHLVAQRDALKWSVGKAADEEERLRAVADAAIAWRRMRADTPTTPKPESAALIEAVDKLTEGSAR